MGIIFGQKWLGGTEIARSEQLFAAVVAPYFSNTQPSWSAVASSVAHSVLTCVVERVDCHQLLVCILWESTKWRDIGGTDHGCIQVRWHIAAPPTLVFLLSFISFCQRFNKMRQKRFNSGVHIVGHAPIGNGEESERYAWVEGGRRRGGRGAQ